MGVMIQRKTHLLRQRYTLETLSYSKIHRILSLLGSYHEAQPPLPYKTDHNYLSSSDLPHDWQLPFSLSLSTKQTGSPAQPPPATALSRRQTHGVKVDLHRRRRFEGKRRPNFTAARSHSLRSGGGHR
ncbi:hypothetical protein NC651_014918 [Populus alba x Populus x berolinensis]|nr:hypothetical protein NC651_014918 [Populus alba x Populus x berolinensis]